MNIREVHSADKFGKRTLLHIGLTLALMSYASLGMAEGDADAQPADEQNTQSLEGIVVSAPDYVPRESNAASKMNVPLIETPQSITVIPRDQIDLLDWQNLSQVVRYTSGVIGENYGPDPRYDWLTLRGFYPPAIRRCTPADRSREFPRRPARQPSCPALQWSPSYFPRP